MKQLSREALQKIKNKLRIRQKVLLEEIRDEYEQADNQHLIDLMGREPGDVGDYSLADEVADMNIALADRQIREFRDIDAAFARLADGSLGDCMDCGGEIEPARLLAYPTARRCLICQEKHEQLYVQENRPKL